MTSLSPISNAYCIDTLQTINTSTDNINLGIENRIQIESMLSKDFILSTTNRQLLLARGHRSHSSHRSSQIGSSRRSVSYTPYQSSQKKAITPIVTPSSAATLPAIKTEKFVRLYSLGERELSIGKMGSDVSQLCELLTLHKYLKQKPYKSTYYDAIVKKAVINFQKDAGHLATGICTLELIEKLKTWDSSKNKNQSALEGTVDTQLFQKDTDLQRR